MERLNVKKRLIMGLTLFSMFFGAGNLIFPPILGALAGVDAPMAFFGFALSAIGFPILGIIAIAKNDGLPRLANRVHPKFSIIFTILIYLSIGPLLAIPRTATTSFEMAITPFYGEHPKLLLVAYSVVFFCIALFMAWRPERLTKRLGKITAPLLLLLIVIMFASCLLHPVSFGEVQPLYANHSAVQGFLDGYQTMDTLAALNFGIVIAINIQNLGIKDNSSCVNESVIAGGIAGFVLLLIYGMLVVIGGMSGAAYGLADNGAVILSNFALANLGNVGMVILAGIFVIACLNTCCGLISSCSEYFSITFKRFSYHQWAVFFAVSSFLIANLGLNQILKFSVPLLNMIYPIAIVLIILSFLHPLIKDYKWIYPLTILIAGVMSIVAEVVNLFSLTTVKDFLNWIPFYNVGLGWIVPSVVVLIGTLLVERSLRKC